MKLILIIAWPQIYGTVGMARNTYDNIRTRELCIFTKLSIDSTILNLLPSASVVTPIVATFHFRIGRKVHVL